MRKIGWLMCVGFLFCCIGIQAQTRNPRYLSYIDQYSPIAVEQMRQYKIPASITLAQGLLESGAGTSKLAKKSNNHFGIKCGSGWKGRSVRHDDDARGECFRAYKSPKDSYVDHSLFLVNGARYAFLFKLDVTDYKGWARGLKKAEYATDPSYANRLIIIIETYELYKYDLVGKKGIPRIKGKSTSKAQVNPHQVYIANDLAYIIARDGDTFKSLSKELGISAKKLISYNDLHSGYTLENGGIVYLKSKHKKALKQHTVHVVTPGESMHSISQKYGIRLKNFYKMNKKGADYIPEVGDRLKLR